MQCKFLRHPLCKKNENIEKCGRRRKTAEEEKKKVEDVVGGDCERGGKNAKEEKGRCDLLVD